MRTWYRYSSSSCPIFSIEPVTSSNLSSEIKTDYETSGSLPLAFALRADVLVLDAETATKVWGSLQRSGGYSSLSQLSTTSMNCLVATKITTNEWQTYKENSQFYDRSPSSNCTVMVYSNNGRWLATEFTSRTCQLMKSEPFNDWPQNEQLCTVKDRCVGEGRFQEREPHHGADDKYSIVHDALELKWRRSRSRCQWRPQMMITMRRSRDMIVGPHRLLPLNSSSSPSWERPPPPLGVSYSLNASYLTLLALLLWPKLPPTFFPILLMTYSDNLKEDHSPTCSKLLSLRRKQFPAKILKLA